MAIIKNNRIYLECEDFDTYDKELMEVINMGLSKYPMIWDQTNMEHEMNGNRFFEVYMTPNKVDVDGNKIFDKSIWVKLVKYIMKKARFAEFGCWKGEHGLIEEIKLNFEILDIEEYGDQISFYVDLEKGNKEYITEDYLDSGGNIKWFIFSLYDNLSNKFTIFNSNHFGEEYCIDKLTEEDIEEILKIVDNNDIYIRINKHNSICREDLDCGY